MNILESIKRLKWYEGLIWLISVLVIVVSFFVFKNRECITLIASLIGVTALIFVAKGDVLGQVLTVVFAIFYAIVSFKFRYWGEMITYLGMTAPIAVGAVVTWVKNPYQKGEVKVRHTNPKLWTLLILVTTVVTACFYFILKFFNTPNLIVSTISITTSFMAASLTMLRSSYYALFYAGNDVALIVLWVLATMTDISYLPMVLCFVMFLVNDLYGFINWERMKKKQGENY
ncbi:MAG: nicotinamide mononucleotide transporter [Lachnospiraceae bacterium]|nr:nicotinamide mononucleotide transporter [Lachnospiraceae bacterium]